MPATLLASRSDVEDRLRRDLTDEEAGPEDRWINGLLEEASVLVTAYCGGRTFADPIPDNVRIVTSRVAARAFQVADLDDPLAESRQDQAGIFMQTVRYGADASSGGVWLTRADKLELAPYGEGRGQVFSIDMTGTGRG